MNNINTLMNNINSSQYPTCASCQYCLEVRCHPWNESIGKGSMNDKLGYVCLLFKDDNKLAIFMNNDKGSCECHTQIKEL